MLKATVIAALLCVSFDIADAQYVVVLKNGRQLTAQNYREEGSVIKFFGLGGEIAISKDQVQTIRRGEASESGGAPRLSLENGAAETETQRPPISSAQPEIEPPAAISLDEKAQKRAEEAKTYENKLKELTARLKELQARYSLITRGHEGPEPSFFTSEEAFRGHQEDLLSRLRDAQNKAQGLPLGGAAASPPFSLDPPPAYSERQKLLSDLRARISQIENERQRLIDEMRAKGFAVGALFLE